MRELSRIILCVLTSLILQKVQGQNIYTCAGTGTAGFSGDGGPATSAQISYPWGIAVDTSGNIYFADEANQRIRKINNSGIITTIAGNGSAGFSGDGGPATLAQLNSPKGIAVDNIGNVYFCDRSNQRIRKISLSGTITTVAGNGLGTYSGDGGPAVSASIKNPYGIAVDGLGNLYIADFGNNRIRKVNATGTITTIAGNGTPGYGGDGGASTLSQIDYPWGVAVDKIGNIYFSDGANERIRKIDAFGIINTYAGNGTIGFSGDGGQATLAQLNTSHGIAIDTSGNLYITDLYNYKIRKVSATGIITTYVGTFPGFAGDGGPATSAAIYLGIGVATSRSGNLFITDNGNERIRIVCGSTICPVTTSIDTPELSNGNFLIYPNPNEGKFNIYISDEISNGKLILINSLGQKVCELQLFRGTNNISADGLSQGLYHYVLIQNNFPTKTGNLTVE